MLECWMLDARYDASFYARFHTTHVHAESRRAAFYSARYIANAHRRTAHVKAAHVHSEAIQAGVPNALPRALGARPFTVPT